MTAPDHQFRHLPLEERLAALRAKREGVYRLRERLLVDDEFGAAYLLRFLSTGPKSREDVLRDSNLKRADRLTALTALLVAGGLAEEFVRPRKRGSLTKTCYRLTRKGKGRCARL